MGLHGLLTWRTEEFPEVEAVALRVSGEVDLSTAPMFLGVLKALIESNGHVVVDLSTVGYFDGSGLRVLVTCQDLARARGRYLFAVAPPLSMVRRLFQILRLDQAMLIAPSLRTVVCALRVQPGDLREFFRLGQDCSGC